MAKVYIESLRTLDYTSAICKGFEWIGLGTRVKPGDRVFIKPNLTFPWFRPGVMTNPECLEAIVVALRDYACQITIIEGDSGGYNPFKIDDVFERIGLNDLARRYGFQVVNLTGLPSRNIVV